VKAPPAFQFYPNDFVSGTRKMTTTEVGAYMLLLCAQWDDGFVPGDDPVALAQTMRCTRPAAVKIWARICEKFIRDDAGRWRNVRLEHVREEQEAFRIKQAQNGAKGANKRWRNDGDGIANRWPDDGDPNGQTMANASPDDGSPISDLRVRTKKQDLVGVVPQKATTTTAPPLIMSPLQYAKALQNHAFVGARLKVPNKLHDDFRRLLGGTDPDARLLPWYHDIDVEIERSGEPIAPDVFKWLDARFRLWIVGTSRATVLQQFVEGTS